MCFFEKKSSNRVFISNIQSRRTRRLLLAVDAPLLLFAPALRRRRRRRRRGAALRRRRLALQAQASAFVAAQGRGLLGFFFKKNLIFMGEIYVSMYAMYLLL